MALQTQGEVSYYYVLETITQINGAYAFLGITVCYFFQLFTKKKLSELY